MLTTSEVAIELSVSTQTIRNLINTGNLKAVKIGKNYRIKLEDFNSYLKVSSTHSNKDLVDDMAIETLG